MWISWSFQTSHNISITEVSNGKHSTILIGRPWNIYPKLSVHDQANRPKLRVGIFISFTRVNKNHSKFNSSNPSESLLIIVPLRQDEIQTLAIQVQNIYIQFIFQVFPLCLPHWTWYWQMLLNYGYYFMLLVKVHIPSCLREHVFWRKSRFCSF